MENCSESGDLAYKFFKDIPSERWASGCFHDRRHIDVYGSNGEYAFVARAPQTSCALGHLSNAIAEDCSFKARNEEETLAQAAGQELQIAVNILANIKATNIPTINDNADNRYRHGRSGEGARLNILHAMLDARGIEMARFCGELDTMMEIAKESIKEAVQVVTGVSFEELMGKDVVLSDASPVALEKDIIEVETAVRVVAGYAEEAVNLKAL